MQLHLWVRFILDSRCCLSAQVLPAVEGAGRLLDREGRRQGWSHEGAGRHKGKERPGADNQRSRGELQVAEPDLRSQDTDLLVVHLEEDHLGHLQEGDHPVLPDLGPTVQEPDPGVPEGDTGLVLGRAGDAELVLEQGQGQGDTDLRGTRSPGERERSRQWAGLLCSRVGQPGAQQRGPRRSW